MMKTAKIKVGLTEADPALKLASALLTLQVLIGLSHADIPISDYHESWCYWYKINWWVDGSEGTREGVAAEAEAEGEPANVFALKKAITEIESRKRSWRGEELTRSDADTDIPGWVSCPPAWEKNDDSLNSKSSVPKLCCLLTLATSFSLFQGVESMTSETASTQ